MKKIFSTLFVVMAFASLSYVSAIADTKKGCDRKEKGESGCADMPANLKLTKEQKAKLDEVMTECKKSKIRTSADIKTARIDLNTLLKKDSIDKAAVDAKVDEIGNIIKKALKAKMDCKVKALAILDAEQKKLYLESDGDEGEHHDCGMKGGHDCGKKDDDCCGKGKECCKKNEDCCKGVPDCCKRGDECCKKGEDCCKKEGKGGCDVKDKKSHDMKGMK